MDISSIAKMGTNINANNVSKGLNSAYPLVEKLINNNLIKDDNDAVSISNEARDVSKNEDPLASAKDDFHTAMELLKNLNATLEGSEEGFEERLKCIKIALRIISGDKVPLKDMKFLAEKDPALYSNALLLKRNNDNPKKYKSLIEDKKADAAADSIDSDASSEAAIAPEAIAEDSISTGDIEVAKTLLNNLALE